MKKVLFGVAILSAMAFTSCGNSTPEDFAKAELDLEVKALKLQTEAYEKATEEKDPNFMKYINDEIADLKDKDEDYKEAVKANEKAADAYDLVKNATRTLALD